MKLLSKLKGYIMNQFAAQKIAATSTQFVAKNVVLDVPEPVAVIFKRDPSGNAIGVLKDSLSFKSDPNGTVSVWLDNSGNELRTLPKSYYDKCDPMSDADVEETKIKFMKAFNLQFVEVKSRLGRNLHSIKAQHTGAVTAPSSVPQANTRRSTDTVVDANDEFKLKMEMILQILPNAVAVAMAQAMQTAVIPAIKSAIDTTIATVMTSNEGPSH